MDCVDYVMYSLFRASACMRVFVEAKCIGYIMLSRLYGYKLLHLGFESRLIDVKKKLLLLNDYHFHCTYRTISYHIILFFLFILHSSYYINGEKN